MHFFHFVRLSHWRVSFHFTLRKIRFLNFVSLGQVAHIAYAFIRLCPRYRVLRFRSALHKIRFLKIPSGSFLGFRCKISYSRNFFASPVIHLGALRSGFALTFVLRLLLPKSLILCKMGPLGGEFSLLEFC